MSAANLIGGIFFGGIGFAAFVYGKKIAGIKAMIIGLMLMGYSYFTPNTMVLYAVGILLTGSLFLFRD